MKISVKYARIDSAHFLTGGDQLSRGLCVAHADPKAVFYDALTQLQKLLELNHKLPVKIKGPPVEAFFRLLEHPEAPSVLTFELENAAS